MLSRRSQLLSICILLAGVSNTAFATSYEYDALDRLSVVTYGNGMRITYSYDSAGNRIGQNLQVDQDQDGAYDDEDNCPGIANPAQIDTDLDGLGNLCDDDDDNDGLEDSVESNIGTDPQNADTDEDRLDDGVEIDLGTDPLNRDTDGDSMPDGVEVSEGLNPLDGSDCPDWYCGNGSLLLKIIPFLSD